MDWLTTAEAAKEAKVTNKTIYRWIAAGRLNADRVGPRLYRIRRSELLNIR